MGLYLRCVLFKSLLHFLASKKIYFQSSNLKFWSDYSQQCLCLYSHLLLQEALLKLQHYSIKVEEQKPGH